MTKTERVLFLKQIAPYTGRALFKVLFVFAMASKPLTTAQVSKQTAFPVKRALGSLEVLLANGTLVLDGKMWTWAEFDSEKHLEKWKEWWAARQLNEKNYVKEMA